MRTSTKLKEVLLSFDIDMKLNAGVFEFYMHNKKTKELCLVDDRTFSRVVQKAFTITNKTKIDHDSTGAGR